MGSKGKVRMSEEDFQCARSFMIDRFIHSDPDDCLHMWEIIQGTKWQNDHDIAKAALSVGLPPEKLSEDLLDDDAFLPVAFGAVRGRYAEMLWYMLSLSMKQDPCVAFSAVEKGVPYDQMPEKIKENKPLILEGLEKGCLSWERLPNQLKGDVEYALSAREYCDTLDFYYMLDRVTNSERLWAEYACKSPSKTEEEDWQRVPVSVRSNPKLMLEAIAQASFTANYIGANLATDEAFVDAALEINSLALCCFPKSTYDAFPEIIRSQRNLQLVLDTFREHDGCTEKSSYKETGCYSDHILRLESAVVENYIMSDRTFIMTWLALGLPMSSKLPAALQDDEEIFLTFAKNDIRNWIYGAEDHNEEIIYQFMSARLLTSKHFILRLLEVAGRADPVIVALRFRTKLWLDPEVYVAAYAHDSYFDINEHSVLESISEADIMEWIEQRLVAYESFVKVFLCGTRAISGSPLSLLNLGSDTSIKRAVGEYLGVPFGKPLCNVFKAARNMHVDGYNPLPDCEMKLKKRRLSGSLWAVKRTKIE